MHCQAQSPLRTARHSPRSLQNSPSLQMAALQWGPEGGLESSVPLHPATLPHIMFVVTFHAIWDHLHHLLLSLDLGPWDVRTEHMPWLSCCTATTVLIDTCWTTTTVYCQNSASQGPNQHQRLNTQLCRERSYMSQNDMPTKLTTAPFYKLFKTANKK